MFTKLILRNNSDFLSKMVPELQRMRCFLNQLPTNLTNNASDYILLIPGELSQFIRELIMQSRRVLFSKAEITRKCIQILQCRQVTLCRQIGVCLHNFRFHSTTDHITILISSVQTDPCFCFFSPKFFYKVIVDNICYFQNCLIFLGNDVSSVFELF